MQRCGVFVQVVKLQRSRNRERELKRLHDPLWDN